MPVKKRTYTGPADLTLLQDFNAAAIAVTDHCGYLHPGDIPHHLFNGNQSYDPPTSCRSGRMSKAWRRGMVQRREMLTYADARTVELMRRYDIAGDCIYADAFQGDTARRDLLLDLGWQPEEDQLPYVLNRTEIGSIDVPVLPDGYAFGAARGVEDAAALAEVQAAFKARWTPELYRKVMESPGYAPERELVIQDPDGAYVAFCIIWFDHLNRTGLFEPVGTHKDYQRRGLGRALLLHGMQRMADAGHGRLRQSPTSGTMPPPAGCTNPAGSGRGTCRMDSSNRFSAKPREFGLCKKRSWGAR
ncbi:MAG: GNAT family N-acetyltransferase [Caldilineaceae bacterium]|nr:GNAT family N-acetyltransferase [Caldilineaceae bacterium]